MNCQRQGGNTAKGNVSERRRMLNKLRSQIALRKNCLTNERTTVIIQQGGNRAKGNVGRGRGILDGLFPLHNNLTKNLHRDTTLAR